MSESNSADPSLIDPADFRAVLGRYPTGVTVVAGIDDGEPVGLAIGSFFSVSLEPPLIGFGVQDTSSSWPRIRNSKKFAVSVLADDQTDTSNVFASPGGDKFANVAWTPSGITGSPLIDGALSYIDCTLEDEVVQGDHIVVFGRVESLTVNRDEASPLLFYRGRYGMIAEA